VCYVLCVVCVFVCEREVSESVLVVVVCCGFDMTCRPDIISLVLITTLDISLRIQTCLFCLTFDSHLLVLCNV